jgi:hypothetical protein
MTEIVKCSECGYEQPADEYDETEPCQGCKGLDEYLEGYGQQRWESQGSQDWFEFWQECERIKGKI